MTRGPAFKPVLLLLLPVVLSGALLIPAIALAEVATPSEMEQVCENWLSVMVSQKGSWAGAVDPIIAGEQEIVGEDGTVLARCYSISPRGFVIVPVLKELPPIKAYSEKDAFDARAAGGMPQLLREVLQHRTTLFVQRYGSLQAAQPATGDVLLGRKHRTMWNRLDVEPDRFAEALREKGSAMMRDAGPLLTTSWNQLAPYNQACPEGRTTCADCCPHEPDVCSPVLPSAAGCVAVAMAQIMNYHEWPPNGTGEHSYEWDGDATCSGGLPTEGETRIARFHDSYDWANMPDDCAGGCTAEQEEALAELCYEAGVSVEMDYGVCGSGTDTEYAVNAYRRYFRYDDTMGIENRDDHATPEPWFGVIQTEIDAGRPIHYRMHMHSLVCDGWRVYESMNQYHMNYGGNVSYNIWYTVDYLTCPWGGCDPMDEYMIYGIQPRPAFDNIAVVGFRGIVTADLSLDPICGSSCENTLELDVGRSEVFGHFVYDLDAVDLFPNELDVGWYQPPLPPYGIRVSAGRMNTIGESWAEVPRDLRIEYPSNEQAPMNVKVGDGADLWGTPPADYFDIECRSRSVWSFDPPVPFLVKRIEMYFYEPSGVPLSSVALPDGPPNLDLWEYHELRMYGFRWLGTWSGYWNDPDYVMWSYGIEITEIDEANTTQGVYIYVCCLYVPGTGTVPPFNGSGGANTASPSSNTFEVSVTFDEVTEPGQTFLDAGGVGPQLPAGHFPATFPPAFLDLGTTAMTTGNVEVCIEYDEAAMVGDETQLALLKYDETLDPPEWIVLSAVLDDVANTICVTTDVLGLFAVTSPTGTADIDFDGITDDIDLEPSVYSDAFSDVAGGGSTSGSISDRGDQVLLVEDLTAAPDDGVSISAHASGGMSAATVNGCAHTSISQIEPEDQILLTCGSSTTTVATGNVYVEFTSDHGWSTFADVDAGNSVTFDPAATAHTARATNAGAVTLTIDGVDYLLDPGETIAWIPPECPADSIVPGDPPVSSVVLSGFEITNYYSSSLSFDYNVTATGPATLVDNGDPASLTGTTPELAPGESFVPPEAALSVPTLTSTSQQIITYEVAAAGDPNIFGIGETTVVFNIVIVDDDEDGIADDIDTQPGVYSDYFSDVAKGGVTSGRIAIRNSQPLLIHDVLIAPDDGVSISVDESGSAAPSALVRACDDDVTLFLVAGDSLILTCGSTVSALAGDIRAALSCDPGWTGSADIPSGNSLSCDPITSTFAARSANLMPLVVGFRGFEYTLEPGEILIWNPPEVPPYETVIMGSTSQYFVLTGFEIKNWHSSSLRFAYQVASTGPARLVDNGDPASLMGTTPLLAPGESYSPPEAALDIPAMSEWGEQYLTYTISGLENPNVVGADYTYVWFDGTVPVLIQEFAAEPLESGVRLTWEIYTDEMIKGFGIYRRGASDGTDELVNPDGLLSAESRTFVDNDVRGGQDYLYTLVIVREDGSEMRSRTVDVKTRAYTLRLNQNHPNPFNPTTTISFTLPARSNASLLIYDITGGLITTLVNGTLDEGFKEYVWDGRDARGNLVSSGVYFYRLKAGKRVLTKKMVLLK